jgi:DNA-binding transcriptional MerR regulator
MSLAAYIIPEKIFFKIGEVCDLVGVQPHVLRYWETEFPMLSPQKNRAGQRTYRRRDVEIALRIKELLYEELYTIAGAKKKLSTELREQTKLKVVPNIEQPRIEKVEPKIDSRNDNDYQVSADLQPKPIYIPVPPVIRNLVAPINPVEPEEDLTDDFAEDEFETDKFSGEKKAALLSLRKQLGELMQILERYEDVPRRAW